MDGIIIVGYGRMGKEIEIQAAAMGVEVCAVANSHAELQALGQNGELHAGRIAIEFTGGRAATANLHYLLQHDVPVVCGSTPWTAETRDAILGLLKQRSGYLMFSSNYSLGVNIFWRVVREASRLMNHFEQYDLGIYERHHERKVDSPSGSALSTAQIVLREVERKTRLLCGNPQNPDGSDRPIAPEELQLSSQRVGYVAGMHQLLCDSPEDRISISHNARSRAGFARGAIAASRFLQEQVQAKRTGFFSMDDLMNYFLTKRQNP